MPFNPLLDDPNKRKVLFLDVDGVIATGKRREETHSFPHGKLTEEKRHLFDPDAVNQLHRVYEETGCGIVLSSTWRRFTRPQSFMYFFNLPVFDRTPIHNHDGACRGGEIKEWLDKQNSVGEGRPTHYAIVDDDSDMLEEQLPFFVQTDFYHGLTTELADELIAILNK